MIPRGRRNLPAAVLLSLFAALSVAACESTDTGAAGGLAPAAQTSTDQSSQGQVRPAQAESYLALGRRLLVAREPDLARRAFMASIYHDGISAAALTGAGIAAQQQGLLHEARRQLERAVELNPEYGDGWLGLVHGYEFLNRVDDARHALGKAESLQSMDRSLPLARARVMFRDKRHEEAIEALTEHGSSELAAEALGVASARSIGRIVSALRDRV